MAGTGQHPWLHPGWKILPTRIGNCSNTNCDHRFRCGDNNVTITHAQPHYYCVRQVEPCHHVRWSSQALCLNNNNTKKQLDPRSDVKPDTNLLTLSTFIQAKRTIVRSLQSSDYAAMPAKWHFQQFLAGWGVMPDRVRKKQVSSTIYLLLLQRNWNNDGHELYSVNHAEKFVDPTAGANIFLGRLQEAE